MRRRAFWIPFAAASLGLAASLLTAFALHRGGRMALDRALAERLQGAGESATALLGRAAVDAVALDAVMRANRLDGAWIVDGSLTVLADAGGAAGVPANLLRVDVARVQGALRGEASVAPAYAVGDVVVASGYFPLRDEGGRVRAVLGLEAGEPFAAARRDLDRALALGALISAMGAVALALVAARWAAAERHRRDAALAAARGEAIARMAATAAHEIRNPLGIIRGSVELMRERGAAVLTPRDRSDLEDILGEVERLRRLTDDFLDLSSSRALSVATVDLAELLEDAARGVELAQPGITVRRDFGALPSVRGDPVRLRQLVANLLVNAAQAQGAGEIGLEASADPAAVRVVVRDRGPGVAPDARERLFEPFFTTKETGTGLGLALSRRIAERHGGALRLAAPGPGGTAFELTLPVG
jgi:two-component system, OmpR family, sensor kinase